MKRVCKLLFLWLVLGMVYFVIEGVWRIPKGGYASIVMVPIGGLCGVLVGAINQYPRFYKMKVICQSAIGAVVVLAVEFVSGMVLNVWLGLGIWDYSGMAFNIYGQVCLSFGIAWLFLMPFAIWLEDRLRFVFWGEGERYSLWGIYTEFITLK